MASPNSHAYSTAAVEVPVRNLSLADIPSIASLHRAAFPHSLLAKLGDLPVQRYYRWQMTSQKKIVALGIDQDDKLVGFCFAGIFRRALSGFISRNAVMLATHLIGHPWVLKNPLYRKRVMVGLRILFFRSSNGSRPSVPIPERFGILSIAVDPEYRRLGYGNRLACACADFAAAMDFRTMFLTVSPKNESAIQFYERMGWHRTSEEGVMRKDMSPEEQRS